MANGIGKVFAKRLHAAFDRTATPEQVNKALSVLQGKLDPLTVPATEAYARLCYHMPEQRYLMLHAADSLLGTHGIEGLGPVDMRRGPPYEYLNTGDSYADTVIYNTFTGKFRMGCWADIAEKMPVDD